MTELHSFAVHRCAQLLDYFMLAAATASPVGSRSASPGHGGRSAYQHHDQYSRVSPTHGGGASSGSQCTVSRSGAVTVLHRALPAASQEDVR